MGICYITRREQREEVSEQLGIYCAGNDARPFGEVEIPNKVITLATRVFQNDENVTKINLPPLLQEIQKRAFENCIELQEIIFPDTLQTINKYAFDGCTKLIVIAVPENIPLLKPYTFGGNNISQLVLKSSFSPKLWDYAYADNHSIKSVDVNCHLISKGCFSGSDVETVIIEGNTKFLKERAFENCKKLINIQLNSDLLEIGDYCFYNTNLSKITIPKTIQRIGVYCFGVNDENLLGLKEVTFQDGLKVISQYSFYGTALESIVIPSSIENIGKYAFGNCTKLVDIQLTDGIKQLGMFEGYAFSNCSVEKIIIPPSIEKITKYCFSDCTKLTRVQFTVNIEKAKLEEGIFKNCTALNDVVLPEDMLYLGNNMFEKCTSLESINLPENLRELGDYCFKGCSKLTSLNIPESIKRIGKYCFEDTSIGKIALPRTVTEIEGYTFSGCTSLGTVEFDYFDTIEEIPVEQGLQVIKSNAFYDSVVTNLNIPYTIQTIEKDAFRGMNIDTLHIDVIKTQAWLDASKTWGMSYKTLKWRQSILRFDSNEKFFELFVSQNDSPTHIKVDTSKSEYIFEPYNEGITLHYWAYAPNKAPIVDSQFFNRIDRENERSFIFEEQAPYKIEFIIRDEDGDLINDAQVTADTLYKDFRYTYNSYVFYVNKDTDIIQYKILRSGYGTVYGKLYGIYQNETINIQLSKNGYSYIELSYPFKEHPSFVNCLVDNMNYKFSDFQLDFAAQSIQNKDDTLAGLNLPNQQSIRINGYIKIRTPNDIKSENTISVSGYTGENGGWEVYFDVIIGPSLYFYPNDYSYKKLPDFNNTNYTQIGHCVISSYASSSPFSFSKKIDTLKPNTYYYIQFSLDKSRQYIDLNDNITKEKVFIKKISFNSCPLEIEPLPDIISGDKICIYDGIGKDIPYINENYFNTSESQLIFEKFFGYNTSVYLSALRHNAYNCSMNRLAKAYSISDTNGGHFDVGIFKFIKSIDCTNYTKIKITCIIQHDYTSSLVSSAYMYVGQDEDITIPEPNLSYNWDNWTAIGEHTTAGNGSLHTCTYDISSLEGQQNMFIGVYHGMEKYDYTAFCNVVELEIQ